MKRTKILSFRLTPEEQERLRLALKKAAPKRSMPDAVRALCLKYAKSRIPEPVKPRAQPRRLPKYDTRLLAKSLGQLGKIGSNVNQLAKRAHIQKQLPSEQMLSVIQMELQIAGAAIQTALNPQEKGHDN
ncbi:plasmid mobilization protein [Terasakiella sp.]|uniref:plasmid mobilization protein n=1 Tax=Terasakiella sp. TaxID=2034861 RepID=UPI003AA7C832